MKWCPYEQVHPEHWRRYLLKKWGSFSYSLFRVGVDMVVRYVFKLISWIFSLNQELQPFVECKWWCDWLKIWKKGSFKTEIEEKRTKWRKKDYQLAKRIQLSSEIMDFQELYWVILFSTSIQQPRYGRRKDGQLD